MPMSAEFAERLLPLLPDLVASYDTPFHIYDARGIVATHEAMVRAFGNAAYRQYFAVKALPNPNVLALLRAAGSGFDCSSAVEVRLALAVGAQAGDIVFTSNNTALSEYQLARAAGALITFDDRSFLKKVDELPETVAFRISPSGLTAGCALMGSAAHSKFGVPVHELAGAYADAVARGARRFGIHGMTLANELDTGRAARAAADVIRIGARIADRIGIGLAYVNVGGGLGIPYREDDKPIDFTAYAEEIVAAKEEYFGSGGPRILTEIGRYVTGPHGVLVTRVINRCRKGHEIAGLDASMSSLMRPALYGAYHHISLPYAKGRPLGRFDVVGALCENLDKFAIDRELPEPRDGDIALVHDTGAHGHAMGFTYNGRLRPAELMLTDGGDVVEIRRAETYDDYTATVRWEAPVRTGA
ncbi:diaminopimelate decarboxylase [Nonomuraea sp. PA05]|nr:diaminopimelate decarboxylase [Nonomuraea sp. PA05]